MKSSKIGEIGGGSGISRMSKVVGKVTGKKSTANAIKSKPARNSKRQAFDIPVDSRSRKTVQSYGSRGSDLKISENVKIKRAVTPGGRSSVGGGTGQVMNQNVRATIKPNKAEMKANARGLKAANKNKSGTVKKLASIVGFAAAPKTVKKKSKSK
jgi:hypothetical protein